MRTAHEVIQGKRSECSSLTLILMVTVRLVRGELSHASRVLLLSPWPLGTEREQGLYGVGMGLLGSGSTLKDVRFIRTTNL